MERPAARGARDSPAPVQRHRARMRPSPRRNAPASMLASKAPPQGTRIESNRAAADLCTIAFISTTGKSMRLKSLLSVLLASLLLGGCSWSDVLLEEADAIPPTVSFGFRQGYLAGCQTGIAQRGGLGFDRPDARRNETRMQTEPDYKAGWEQGEHNCVDRYAGLILHRDLMIR